MSNTKDCEEEQWDEPFDLDSIFDGMFTVENVEPYHGEFMEEIGLPEKYIEQEKYPS